MGCEKTTVSCPHPATHMPCVLVQVIYSFLICTADACYMGSLSISPVINIKFIHISWSISVIFHQDKFIWKNFPTYVLGAGKNICMSNNDYSSIKKLSEWPEQSSCRESKKHSYVWLACGTKADTILAKSPRPLPCPFLTINLLSIFDPCPGSWSKTPDNFGVFFFFHRCQDY